MAVGTILGAACLSACVGEDILYVPPSEPVIGGIPARVDTVGRAVRYTIPVSLDGGSAKQFNITPSLPAGLRLDTAKGVISGTPTMTSPETVYTIIAAGFGGSDTATFVIRITALVPVLSYASPVIDTLSRPVSHSVISNGAAVTSFSISPALPSGLLFSTSTGRITGTPTTLSSAQTYTVTATGPKGTGTATITLSVVDQAVTPPPPPPPTEDTSGMTASITLERASGIPLSKLVITVTSSNLNDAVVRDTILVGQSGFTADPGGSQTVIRFVTLKPLRNHSVQVKTLDDNDSAIHVGSGTVNALLVGEKRSLSLTLTARYAAYTARITLQDNANDYDAGINRTLTFTRATFVIGSDTIYDTLATGGAFPTTGVRLIGTRYVPADKIDQLKIYFYGTATGWNAALPILSYENPWIGIAPYAPGTTVYEPLFLNFLTYTGPGSAADPGP